jgi:hypothetical protein
MTNEIVRLECWLSEDGNSVEGSDAQYDINYDGNPYIFIGKGKTYIVWHEWPFHSVARWAALQFAILHHERKLRTISIDLSKI